MHFLLSLDLLENDFGSTTYNADFDDDDINVHFSQDEISRVGACCIVNVKNQYVRPSNEDPLQALIQVLHPRHFFTPLHFTFHDHIVIIFLRTRFWTKQNPVSFFSVM